MKLRQPILAVLALAAFVLAAGCQMQPVSTMSVSQVGITAPADFGTVKAVRLVALNKGSAVRSMGPIGLMTRGLNKAKAQEMTIKRADGQIVVLVQECPPEFMVGDQVMLLTGGGRTRVVYPVGEAALAAEEAIRYGEQKEAARRRYRER